MKLHPPITDHDIEALLAGQLSPERRRVVEDHLEHNPVRKAEVDALRADQDALRAIADELLAEPVPDRLLALLADDDILGEDEGAEAFGAAIAPLDRWRRHGT